MMCTFTTDTFSYSVQSGNMLIWRSVSFKADPRLLPLPFITPVSFKYMWTGSFEEKIKCWTTSRIRRVRTPIIVSLKERAVGEKSNHRCHHSKLQLFKNNICPEASDKKKSPSSAIVSAVSGAKVWPEGPNVALVWFFLEMIPVIF